MKMKMLAVPLSLTNHWTKTSVPLWFWFYSASRLLHHTCSL